MGKVSNLITDMTIQRANTEKLHVPFDIRWWLSMLRNTALITVDLPRTTALPR
jgi:hypothetical protein